MQQNPCPVENGQCRTLCGIAKLMVLRQKALSKSVSSHLNDLRDVFADVDPAFRGTEMQDANEFLLRLLDTMKDEIDERRSTDNPVRDNFQYQTVESYKCTKCHETVLKCQENISWFVSVPRRQGTEAPTLQDALQLSMQPDRRELLCHRCHHGECRVTTKISQLPRINLNRCVFLGEESKKIRANVGIPKFLSLKEFVADDVTRPPEWMCTKPSLYVPDAADSDSEPRRNREDKGRELRVVMRSLEEREPADALEQVHLPEFSVEDNQLLCPVDLVGDSTYRLVGVISHYGGTAHSGHYVSDVYSVGRGMWLHYDDHYQAAVIPQPPADCAGCLLESLWLRVKPSTGPPFKLAVVYRPPRRTAAALQADIGELELQYQRVVLQHSGPVLIMGDLNCNLLDTAEGCAAPRGEIADLSRT
ncbi:Ubiquitin carboxyl-terminal hydrolase 37 [Amphibalanus amphitrite]|uniref:Ubiquitin carboxyl-terminal hydrolase 37 n=1 Tax=Amphibalanus amphitrite TaxID=1232801 RepID=A0A6A4WJY4_AMPAM|nr:Ubiquitin carboxyl-terminal hydrolase 37 [Amphibalanus amphitrite]